MKTNLNGRNTSPTAEDRFSEIARKIVAAIVLVCFLTACSGGGGVASGAAQTLKTQRFVSLAENSSEFSAIFGRKPKARESTEIGKNLSKAEEQGFTIVKPATSNAADEFIAAYQNSEDDVVTLVGHNQGGRFYFGDGSWVSLENLANDATRPHLVVISCQSSRYAMGGQAVGIPIDVGYAIAFRTEELLLERLRQLDDSARNNLALVEQELDEALNRAIQERNIRVTAYAIGGMGAAGAGRTIIVE